MRARLAVGATVLALGLTGTGVAGAALQHGDGNDGHVTGPHASQAVAAALRATGGGRANAVERDTAAGATWEVEVTKPDGSTVGVRLDRSYAVVVIDDDHEDARR